MPGENKLKRSPLFQDLNQYILQKMKKDEVYDTVTTDSLILTFGSVLLKKFGPKRANDIA